jgi:hypothetical protein
MRIALWRYGLPLQSANESTVGGGGLSMAVIETLLEQGHQVDIVGPCAKDFSLRKERLARVPRLNLRNYDAAVILTGTYNPLYGDSAFDTYRRLALFEGPVVYCQWDVALPFHFNAMLSPKASVLAGVTNEDVHRNKSWRIMAQTKEADLRAKGSTSVGYNSVPFRHVSCLFELAELRRPFLPVSERRIQAVGYFGSDRPGRIAELRRWFCTETSPDLHVYGRWSDASKAKVSGQNIVHLPPIAEDSVASWLNSHLCTMYLADAAYVKTDFIAQRFFENAVAGLPTLYSNAIQPSIKPFVSPWICSSNEELTKRFAQLRSQTEKARAATVAEHRAAVQAFASSRTDAITPALKEALEWTA